MDVPEAPYGEWEGLLIVVSGQAIHAHLENGGDVMNGLPIISKCEENDCFYNRDESCHAAAINVGQTHPRCDTFARAGGNHIGRQPVGMVGACHVAACRWNRELMCSASAIAVGRHGDHPDCLTFEQARS